MAEGDTGIVQAMLELFNSCTDTYTIKVAASLNVGIAPLKVSCKT